MPWILLVIWSFFVGSVMLATWDAEILFLMFVVWAVIAVIIFGLGRVVDSNA